MHFEDADGKEDNVDQVVDLEEVVRRSLLATQHLREIEEQARELSEKTTRRTPPPEKPAGEGENADAPKK
jgi:hypothetical protein